MYGALPVGLQHLICSAEGYRLQRMRFDNGFDDLLRDVEARSGMTHAQVETLRDESFGAFVSDASTGSTFYREHGAFRAIVEGQASRASNLPILDKETVHANVSRIARRDLRTSETASTSGSTGMGLRFPVTSDAIQRQWATWWRFRRWHGIERQEW